MGKATGSRERAPDDRLRVPTIARGVPMVGGEERVPTLRFEPHTGLTVTFSPSRGFGIGHICHCAL